MLALDIALQAKLQADTGAGGVVNLATSGSHKIQAPQGTTGIFITFQNVSSVEEHSFGRIARINCVYLLKAYDDGLDWDTTDAIIERAKTLLFDAAWTLSGFTVESRGSNQFDTQEDVGGTPMAVTVGYVRFDLLPA